MVFDGAARNHRRVAQDVSPDPANSVRRSLSLFVVSVALVVPMSAARTQPTRDTLPASSDNAKADPGVKGSARGSRTSSLTAKRSASRQGNDTGLQSVVVTARRVRTKLQDTPVADTVFTGRQLRLQRIQSIGAVTSRTPGASYIQLSNSESYISIRGTLVDAGGPGYNSAVTVFLDDVPLTGLGDTVLDLYDLSSVEVLRGPQGTLFGRNVTGGAVLIHTEQPTFKPLAEGEVTYGSYNYTQARAVVNGPIIDGQLAGRIAFSTTNQDDYYKNVTLNDETGGVDTKNVRVQLLWTPTDNLKVTFGGDYYKDESTAKVTQLDAQFRPILYPNLSYNREQTNEGLSDTGLNRDTGGAVIRVEWTMPWAQFTSISGYRHVGSYYPFSQIGDPTNQAIEDVTQRANQISEEVHLASLPSRNKLSWLGGLFLLQSTESEVDRQAVQPNPNVALFSDTVLGAGGPFEGAQIDSRQGQTVTDRNVGVFGELTYAITHTLKATFGARYTFEAKHGTSSDVRTSPSSYADPALEQLFTSIFTPTPSALVDYSHSWDAFTPKFNLSYQPVRNLLLYGTIARGFKSGGYDLSGAGFSAPVAVENASFAHPFAPEIVWSYEVGEKLTTLHNKLAINTALYLAQYQNLQVQELDIATGTTQTSNAGSAQTSGAEVEVLARPFPWLQTGASYAYTDAHYVNYILQNGPGLPPSNYDGNRIPVVPRHNLHLTVATDFSIPQVPGIFLVGGDMTYKSRLFFRDDNVQPKFVSQHSVVDGLLNAYVTWESDSARWRFSVFCKNITNQFSAAYGIPVSGYYDTPAEYANPRDNIWLSYWNLRRQIGFTLGHTF